MTATNVKRAFSTPESQFRHPKHVLRDSDLSYDDKIAVLRNWKLGLVQRQMEVRMWTRRGASKSRRNSLP